MVENIDQIAALDAIGFDWRSYIEQWPEKHGHISLGKKDEESVI
jgi:hypothetical protein